MTGGHVEGASAGLVAAMSRADTLLMSSPGRSGMTSLKPDRMDQRWIAVAAMTVFVCERQQHVSSSDSARQVMLAIQAAIPAMTSAAIGSAHHQPNRA